MPAHIVVLLLSAASLLAVEPPPPCVFCEIVAGRRPAAVVHRDAQVVAFLDRAPRNPGHVLIVPVAHADDYLAVPADTLARMSELAQRLGRALRATDLNAEGIGLVMNTGRAAGQSVFHAHLHVIPRHAGEAAPTGEGRITPVEKLELTAGKIRAALAGLPTAAPPAVTIPAAAPITDSYDLPAPGEEVPLPRLREICAHYGLHDLWRKIERDPPPRPFKSDGCTGWFDEWKGVSLYPAGFLHDLKYWAGYPGEDVERLVADAELMRDVARLLGSTEMAETMFSGVRLGGTAKFKLSFSWGFGRQPAARSPDR